MTGENIISGVLNTVTSTVKNTVTRLDPTRWQGYSHDELYKMLQDGPGAAASALPTERWTEIAGTLADIDANLRGALTRSADGWHGDAASTAYSKLGALANWADSAGENATAMRDATQRQAENIAKARADMPAPTKVPSAGPDQAVAPVMQVVSLLGDQESPDAAASTGEQAAHDVMTTYQLNTESTVESLGNFVAPERIAPQQGGAHSNGHGHGVQGLTSVAGLVNGLLGITGHESHGNNGHHFGGGGTSQSNSNWPGQNHGGPSFSAPSESNGGRPSGGGYGPFFSGYGNDREETRRGNNPGRGPLPGGGTPGGADLGHGPSTGTGFGNGVHTGNGAGGFSGVLGSPTGGATPSNAAAGAHNFTSTGGNPAAAAFNPNEMPPPAATANGTMTSAAGSPGAAGAAAAQGGGADKLLGRRGFDLGQGPAGSSWLAEPEPAMPSSVRGGPSRRRDFKAQVRVTERVSVDGEDVDLPETVIGEGQQNR